MSSIHYKFRATLEFQTLQFEGLHISASDIKRQVFAKENIKTEAFELLLSNAHTKRSYAGDDLVPRNSSVIIQRIPREDAKKLPKIQGVGPGIVIGRESTTDPDNKFVTHIESEQYETMTEEERLAHIKSVSSNKYDPVNFQKRPTIMSGPPPPTYTCSRCYQPGHWYKNCPLATTKRTTGIPAQELMSTTKDDPHAMLHPSGSYVKPIMHHEARTRRQKNEDGPTMERVIPPEFICPLCNSLLKDAVLTSCCCSSFCADCVSQFVLESPDHKCPGEGCGRSLLSVDMMIPNKPLRQSVDKWSAEASDVIRKVVPQSLPSNVGYAGFDSSYLSNLTSANTVPPSTFGSSQYPQGPGQERAAHFECGGQLSNMTMPCSNFPPSTHSFQIQSQHVDNYPSSQPLMQSVFPTHPTSFAPCIGNAAPVEQVGSSNFMDAWDAFIRRDPMKDHWSLRGIDPTQRHFNRPRRSRSRSNSPSDYHHRDRRKYQRRSSPPREKRGRPSAMDHRHSLPSRRPEPSSRYEVKHRRESYNSRVDHAARKTEKRERSRDKCEKRRRRRSATYSRSPSPVAEKRRSKCKEGKENDMPLPQDAAERSDSGESAIDRALEDINQCDSTQASFTETAIDSSPIEQKQQNSAGKERSECASEEDVIPTSNKLVSNVNTVSELSVTTALEPSTASLSSVVAMEVEKTDSTALSSTVLAAQEVKNVEENGEGEKKSHHKKHSKDKKKHKHKRRRSERSIDSDDELKETKHKKKKKRERERESDDDESGKKQKKKKKEKREKHHSSRRHRKDSDAGRVASHEESSKKRVSRGEESCDSTEKGEHKRPEHAEEGKSPRTTIVISDAGTTHLGREDQKAKRRAEKKTCVGEVSASTPLVPMKKTIRLNLLGLDN